MWVQDLSSAVWRSVISVARHLGPPKELARERNRLLPIWIKLFCIAFILLTVGIPYWAVRAAIEGREVGISLFGVQYRGPIMNLEAILLLIAFSTCGATAYGLPWGRSWGMFAGLLLATGGLILSLASVFLGPRGSIRIPLEPALLIPFGLALWKRRTLWKENLGD
jgi:hypothetical protein